MLTISLYKQYQEYRRCLRDSTTELSIFLKQFERHILDLEDIIYEQCTIKELKILNFILSCNLSDEDIIRVLVRSNECTGIFPGSGSKKIFETLSGYLTGSFKIETKKEEVYSARVVVVKILKKGKIGEGDTDPDIGIDYCSKTSEDEDGNVQSQEELNRSKIKSLHEKFYKQGPVINETDNPSEKKKIVKVKGKIVRRVKCDQCGRLVPRGRIKVHIRRVHTDTRVPCPLCGKMVNQHIMTQHVRTHRTVNSEVFQCEECDFSSHHKKYLLGHISRNHRKKEFGCEICGKLFDAGATLNRHVMNSHGDKVTCPSCPFQTRNADVLQTHINSHHSAAVVFSCVFCTFETGNSRELQFHLSSHHPENKISALDVRSCARNTVRASKSKKETTERPKIVYKCEYHNCEYTVGDKGSLKKHVEKKHLKILYDCEFCDHVTGLKASLKTHKLRKHHAQFKMYSCHLCNFKTQSKDLLQKHVSGLKHNF